MKISITYFFILIFILSCKKEACRRPDTTVTGTVVDENTLLPIADVSVTLIWEKCKRDFLGVTCSDVNVLESVKTDTNGFFLLKFCKIHEQKEYRIDFDKAGYLESAGRLEYFMNSNVIVKLKK